MRVREELRERRTGLPCDERSSMSESFSLVPKRLSLTRSLSRDGSTIEVKEPAGVQLEDSPRLSRLSKEEITQQRSARVKRNEEKADVRRRSGTILEALVNEYAGHSTVALVTHKGWLREFEV